MAGASGSGKHQPLPDSGAAAPLKPSAQRRRRRAVNIGSSVFLSNWFYLWTFALISHARATATKGQIVLRKLRFRIADDLTARANGRGLDDAWKHEVEHNPDHPKVLNALKAVYRAHYFLIGLWKIVWGVFTWLGAWYFLKVFILFLQNNEDAFVGHMWALALFLSSFLSSIAIHQLYGECAKEGVRIKSALTVLVYRKALVLARVRGGAGEVINIVSTDIARVQDAVLNFHFLWTSALETILILILAFYEIGYSAFTSLGIIILLAPVQIWLGKITSEIQRSNTEITTQRVHVMSEVLTAIKLIKFYAWEAPFSAKINEIRHKEMELIYYAFQIKAINYAVVFATPVIVAIVALATYRFTGHTLTSSLSFTILSVFNTLRYPLLMTPQAVKSFSGASVSLDRLTAYMTQPEVQPIATQPIRQNDPTSIELKSASFTWEGESRPALQHLSLKVNRGEILAVIGDVGSGKSSLVAALLGQMNQTAGDPVKIYGSMSYVPQEAWLLNFSLRENILFGCDYEKARYDEVIRVCALTRDLTLLAAGDQTEIAERGANLSGGQRQRTSLARAVYADADVVLLDDPLSAVDQAVGRHIFNECIKGHLRGKTIVLVTHQLQYLSEVDKVVHLKDGKIARYGTFTELMQDETFAELINNHVAGGEEGDDDIEAMPLEPTVGNAVPVPVASSSAGGAPADVELNQLTVKSLKTLQINEQTISSMIERNQLSVIKGVGKSHDVAGAIQRNELTIHSLKELQMAGSIDFAHDSDDEYDSDADGEGEERRAGQLVTEDKSAESLGWTDYVNYARAGHGSALTVFTMIFFFVVHGVRIGSDYWLKCWIPDSLKLGEDGDAVYVGTYAGFIVLFAAGVLARGLLFAREAAAKARFLHDRIFQRILRAPMSFYDTTPLGRILSAFAKHQFHVDETMPDSAMQGLQYVPLTLGAFLLVAIIVPWNWAPIIGLLIIAALVIYWVTPVENALKAQEAVSRSPIFSHLGATLEGLFSIRAYRAQTRFDALNMTKLDDNHELFLALSLVKSWTALYMDIITSIAIYVTALLMVVCRNDLGTTAKERASTGGLAMSNALQILVFLQWSIRMIGEVQAQMSSVGVLTYYATQVKQEAPAEIKETQPAATWPTDGRIKFDDVVLKYHEFGVAVLKNVSLTIEPKEKIGIVGRTGSGKSTLLVSLLRIVEACNGKVTIDGIDVSKIGLKNLREAIAIIPQEPVLFKGDIRYNLDPFNRSTDEEVWRALEAVHLADTLRVMPLQLESPVIENGKNWSLGQRQLFCIARAILSRAKILVLDEASASIDMQTDALIQASIKKNFADLTVLTIAHRLNTIIESDRVLVMEAGQLVEFDEPLALLDRPNGHFASLVANTGEATAAKLRVIAQAAHNERVAKRTTKPDAAEDPALLEHAGSPTAGSPAKSPTRSVHS
ncbi:hypothetical protein AMAG_11802 [Allomyces macrogynus ATCC 38327]|uniref:P-loop containing nucleoside triphosphate hydrolase protein n=1 Tax=Allomyces macrogynus (strain ATCC 38327) TaxID=578462 RepID=A0A0L0SXV8_ALLM3|nr:hypothetical protein AMAG_11802 [Allomyces macrogynus ATCC 38327]|eukprot:KNE67331.1 hypothetical protein AMAG_11802 [Allomyces macrogynus ATCC 38327]